MFAYYMKILKFNNGNYKGNVKNSLPHGIGEFEKYKIVKNFSVSGKELTKEINEVYKGDWKNGQRHGQGKMTWAIPESAFPKSWYQGSWQNNKFHGWGSYTHSNGDKYEGNWNNYKKHGQGTFTWYDGSYYVGEFKHDSQHGYGVVYKTDGSIIREGIFENDLFLYTKKKK